MTIPPAAADLPAVHVSHGPGFLMLALRDNEGQRVGTVLSTARADQLADELRSQATEARRLEALLFRTD